jgi:hypothetical protein
MVMESEYMVDGDSVDDDGGEDGVGIPLSGVKSRINLTRKEDHADGGALFREKLLPPTRIGFRGILEGTRKEEVRHVLFRASWLFS